MAIEEYGRVVESAGWAGGAAAFKRGIRVELGFGWWCFEDLEDGDLGYVLVSPEGDLEYWFDSVADALEAVGKYEAERGAGEGEPS